MRTEKKTTQAKTAKKSTGNLPVAGLNNKDSNASPTGAKCRVTFLVGQMFRGTYRQAGEFIILPELDANAYSMRSNLKIESVEKDL